MSYPGNRAQPMAQEPQNPYSNRAMTMEPPEMSPEERAKMEARYANYMARLAAARPGLKKNWVEHNNNNNNNNNNSNSNNNNYTNNYNNYEKQEGKRLLAWWTEQDGEEKAKEKVAEWKKDRANFRKSMGSRKFRQEFGLPDPKKTNLRQVGRQLGHRQLINNAARNELRERQRLYGWRASRRANRKTRKNRRS